MPWAGEGGAVTLHCRSLASQRSAIFYRPGRGRTTAAPPPDDAAVLDRPGHAVPVHPLVAEHDLGVAGERAAELRQRVVRAEVRAELLLRRPDDHRAVLRGAGREAAVLGG